MLNNKLIKEIVTFDSGKSGPTVTIIGGAHGNELCGLEALEYFKKNIKLVLGKIHLIIGNPQAVLVNKRKIQMDLNRSFRSDDKFSAAEKETYEYKRSRKIIPYLDDSDILIDIHSTLNKNISPFVICEPHSQYLAKYIKLPIICYGFDDVHPGSSDFYMNKNHKVGICIECGSNNDKNSIKIAIESVENILCFLEMIYKENKAKSIKQEIFKTSNIYITKTNNFKLAREFKNFEAIKQGEFIAIDGNKKIFSDKEQFIIFSKEHNRINGEGFIYLDKLTE